MKRRDFIRTAGITAAGASTAAVVSCGKEEKKTGYSPKGSIPAEAKARKIVFIMTDTTRRDMLGCYGNASMKTPNLDKLAAEGMRFERAYTCSPVSSPARGAIFTGTYPHTNAVWGNDMPLGDNLKTIGQRLSDNGYRCGYMGKWHLSGSDYFDTGICPPGWDPDYWYDERVYLYEMGESDRTRSRKNNSNEEAGFTFGHKVADKAIKFLDEHGSEPFFLSVSLDEPHGPCICPKEYSDMYQDYIFPRPRNVDDNLDNKPELQKLWSKGFYKEKKDKFELKKPFFFGSNSFADYEIGRVLDKIKVAAPDALIFFTSDHGDMLGSHSIWSKGPAPYDEITRIPFIAKWEGRVPANTVSKELISHINIVPSILEAAGVPVPDSLEGISMMKTLLDPAAKTNDYVFVEFGRQEVDHDGFGNFQPMRCIFDGRYKLNINLFDLDELYDHDTDPDEMINQINNPKYAKIRNKMHDQLLEWQGRTRDPFRGMYWNCRPWRTDKHKEWEDTGLTRSRPDDGYLPRLLDYENGLEVKEYVRKK